MELKHKIKTIISVDYNDLNKFLTERFDLTEPYELAAMEELSSGMVKSINVYKDDLDEYGQDYLDEFILVTRKPKHFCTGILLCHLCNKGEIPEGEYLINV